MDEITRDELKAVCLAHCLPDGAIEYLLDSRNIRDREVSQEFRDDLDLVLRHHGMSLSPEQQEFTIYRLASVLSRYKGNSNPGSVTL